MEILNISMWLIQIDEINRIIGIKNVTTHGLLILIIVALCWYIVKSDKKHDSEKKTLQAMIVKERDKLEEEYKTSNSEVKIIIEKYATLATRIAEILKIQI